MISTRRAAERQQSSSVCHANLCRTRAEYGFGEHGFKPNSVSFLPSLSCGQRTQWANPEKLDLISFRGWTEENLVSSVFCCFSWEKKNEFSATPRSQLNWTRPIANSSDFALWEKAHLVSSHGKPTFPQTLCFLGRGSIVRERDSHSQQKIPSQTFPSFAIHILSLHYEIKSIP